MKTCRRCGEEKPHDAFGRQRESKDGLHSWCRECKNARSREKYAADPEYRAQLSVVNKHWRDAHPDYVKEANRAYREANRAKLLEQKREQYQENKEHYRAINQAWKERNPERHKFLQRRSHLKNIYNLTVEQYEAMLMAQGGACAVCMRPAQKRLKVDHDHACCPGKRSCGVCVRGLLCGGCNAAVGWLETHSDRIRQHLEGSNNVASA